jgi:hypothetical protein
VDRARIDYSPRRKGSEAMLRLTIPRDEDIAFIEIPFSALRVVASALKRDDETNMRAAFREQVFRLNAKLTERVSRLPAGQVLQVTAAMLGGQDDRRQPTPTWRRSL